MNFKAGDSAQFILEKIRLLNEKEFDGYCITLNDSGSFQNHAVALIKKGDNFLLLDSNYDVPILLKLAQLIKFIVEGRTRDSNLDEKLEGRNYCDYKMLIIWSGFYKGDDCT
jgi:hypothetical protein